MVVPKTSVFVNVSSKKSNEKRDKKAETPTSSEVLTEAKKNARKSKSKNVLKENIINSAFTSHPSKARKTGSTGCVEENLVVPDLESGGRSRRSKPTIRFKEPRMNLLPDNPREWKDENVRDAVFELLYELSQRELVKLCPFSQGMISRIKNHHYAHKIGNEKCLQFAEWYFKYKKNTTGGEPMEQLSLYKTTLEEEGIKDGESLRVLEGRTPVKEFLCFHIYLYPSLIQSSKSISMNGLHTGIESLHQRFGGSADCYRNFHLGDVEISRDSTVADLKNKVLTLEPLAVESIPNIRHLRLQLIDNGRPSRVLKGLSNTLKILKIHSQNLAATILHKEEDLMHSEMLLNVCQRIPDSESYAEPIELIWDTSKSSTLKHLKQTIANSFQVPIQRIVIAKHFPEKYQWLIIDDSTQNSPYCLKDGDRIGVKDRASDLDDKDDFMTYEAIQGLELIRIAADNKRIKRQEEISASSSNEYGNDRKMPKHAENSEDGINILVEDFTLT